MNKVKDLNKVKDMSKLKLLALNENCSLISLLNEDPETNKNQPNKISREVKSGHYVRVKPTPLPNPYLVIYSPKMASSLGLDNETCLSNDFLYLFSGTINDDKNAQTIGKQSWATPYALSIYGQEMYSNCPFKNGNGYGDGRAISISEVVIQNTDSISRWELQLKGGGTTPFCRGGDGRAVLRSCIREFLASEAMFNLQIPTTRALSIIASSTEKVSRQWYDDKGKEIMENSICAILCRVSSSFIRIGHLELYARRVRDDIDQLYKLKISKNQHSKTKEMQHRINELKLMVNYSIFREFPHLNNVQNEQDRYIMMLKDAGAKIAIMITDWMRVGYTQGNFNSDNCHVAGKTIDYGPFGFIEIFDPSWNMWKEGGIHFSFINQQRAGNKNFCSLVDSVIPLLSEENVKIANELKTKQYQRAIDSENLMWAQKLGFNEFNSNVSVIKMELFKLMELYMADFTLFWRQLAHVVQNYSGNNYSELFKYIQNCFYKTLTVDDEYKWVEWLSKWLTLLKNTNPNYKIVSNNMRKLSPKFVPREWMLKMAYEKANTGDYMINELQKLFETPYDEHDGEMTIKYYKKMKIDKSTGNSCSMAGKTFMSCSS